MLLIQNPRPLAFPNNRFLTKGLQSKTFKSLLPPGKPKKHDKPRGVGHTQPQGLNLFFPCLVTEHNFHFQCMQSIEPNILGHPQFASLVPHFASTHNLLRINELLDPLYTF